MVGPVVINEIMFNPGPAGQEFIEYELLDPNGTSLGLALSSFVDRSAPAPELALWVGLLTWPFVDRTHEAGPLSRRVVILIRIMGVVLIAAMILLAFLPHP